MEAESEGSSDWHDAMKQQTSYPGEKVFYWNLNFAISLMANSLNFNSAYFNNFRNLSMKAYMIEIEKIRIH